MKPPRSLHSPHALRIAALPMVVAAALTLSACGDDEAAVATDTTTNDSVVDVPASDLDAEGVVGLEVTAVGNVSEILDPNGFRIDKDGLGGPTDPAGTPAPGSYYDYYDYDYYDYDDLTEYDEDFGDADIADAGLLVLNVSGTEAAPVAVGDKLRVSGTIRRLDRASIDTVYGVDLAEDLYQPYEDRLVLVADSVAPADKASAKRGNSPPSAPATTPSG